MLTVTVDDDKRVRIPDAKPGQVLACEQIGEGQWTLTTVEKRLADPRPLDPHMYDDLTQEQIDLENATAKWAAAD